MLLDPVLSELYDGIVNKKYTPTSSDCTAAIELMNELSRGFENGSEVQEFIDYWAAKDIGTIHFLFSGTLKITSFHD